MNIVYCLIWSFDFDLSLETDIFGNEDVFEGAVYGLNFLESETIEATVFDSGIAKYLPFWLMTSHNVFYIKVACSNF